MALIIKGIITLLMELSQYYEGTHLCLFFPCVFASSTHPNDCVQSQKTRPFENSYLSWLCVEYSVVLRWFEV